MTKPLGKADSGFACSEKLTKWPWFSLRSIAKVKGKPSAPALLMTRDHAILDLAVRS
jgi:hypothetical protein